MYDVLFHRRFKGSSLEFINGSPVLYVRFEMLDHRTAGAPNLVFQPQD